MPSAVAGVRRVVAEGVVFDEVPEDVDAEAVDAAVEPEAEDVEHGLLDFGVAPVEVGLGGEEGVVVVLAGGVVELPGAAAEVAEPVVGRAAVGGGVAPDVPVALGVVARRSRFDEPGVLVGGVVGDEVEEHLQAAAVGFVDEAVEVGEGAEERVDVGVVGDVVAEVGHRGGEDGGEPDGVDAEPLEVVEALDDAGEVADAVAVGVLEGAGVDLVDDAALPPLVRCVLRVQ